MATEMEPQPDLDDPEMREIERQSVYLAMKHNSQEIPEKKAEIAKDADEDLEQELKDLDSDEESKDDSSQKQERLDKLERGIAKCIAEAEKAKTENNLAECNKYLSAGNKLKKEKAELLAANPSLKPAPTKAIVAEEQKAIPKKAPTEAKNDKIVAPKLGDLSKLSFDDIEEKFHNTERMSSVLVLMEELTLMDKKIAGAGAPEEKSYYQDRKEVVKFKKDSLETGIEGGLITQEKYLHDLGIELKFDMTLLAGFKATNASPEDISRVEKRIELIQKELQGMSGAEEPAPPPPPPAIVEEQPKASAATTIPSSQPPPAEDKKENHSLLKPEEESGFPDNKRQKSFDPEDIVVKEMDLSKADKKQYELVNSRISAYRKAAEYLLTNGMSNQSQVIIKRVDHLQSSLSAVVEGKKLDTLKIEPPLTAEIMFGLSHEKRVKLLQEIVGHLQRLLSSHNNALQQVTKGVKKDKATARGHLTKVQEADRWIAYMKEAMNNDWQPIPAYHFDTITEERQVLQKDVPANVLLVEYVPDPKMLSKKYYNIEYELSNGGESVSGTFDAFDKAKVKIGFPAGTKLIHEAQLSLKLIGRAYFVFTPTRAETSTKLSALESQTCMSIPFSESRGKYKLSVTVRVRVPSNGKGSIMSEHQEIAIDRTYPAYMAIQRASVPQKPRAQPEAQRGTAPVAAKSRLPATATTAAAAAAVPKPTNKGGADPPLPKVLENLPPEIREIDVRDPDDIGNLICASYLQTKIATYTAEIKRRSDAKQKVPEEMKKKLVLMTRNCAAIEGQIESGKITPAAYKGFLERQLGKDQKLYVYLQKLGQKTRMGIVGERIKCIMKEVKSF